MLTSLRTNWSANGVTKSQISMASSGLFASGEVDRKNSGGLDDNKEDSLMIDATQNYQNCKSNRLEKPKKDHTNAKPSLENARDVVTKTTPNNISDNNSNNSSKTQASFTQSTDKTHQQTSSNVVQDILGSDNDRLNSNNNERHTSENKSKKQTSVQQCNSSNEKQQTRTNESSTNLGEQQQRRESNPSKTCPSGSQQKAGGDLSSTTTLSKFKEKRPEPLKLSSNLNQEIPLDLSVRR